jgi:hypothetical protein
MTLAVILLTAIFTVPASLGRGNSSALELMFEARPANFAATQDATASDATKQDQATTPTQSPSNSSKPASSASHSSQTSTSQTSAMAKSPRRKKKPVAVNCDAPAGQTKAGQTTASTGSRSTPGTADAKAAQPAAPGGPSSAASTWGNCPPAKKIVRQGGSSEPSVQLVGGKGGQQASADKASANQLRDLTEENLKKIAGQQLTSNQQDMVEQVRQFVSQSKTAEATGDVERAHALALKAQLLSQELVKPQQ